MTLCLAATCTYEDEPCVVACCDFSGNKGAIVSQDIDKMRWVGDSHVMLAGALSSAKELVAACEKPLLNFESGQDDLKLTDLMESLRDAVRRRRRSINNAYLSSEFGLSFDEFFNHGKTQFTEGHYLQIWQSINSLDLESELIISSFLEDEAVLIRVGREGRVIWEDHYSAIGSGAAVCMAFLAQRDYDDSMSLDQCLYLVLEAKVAAEKTPDVGEATKVVVLTPEQSYDLELGFLGRALGKIEQTRKSIPSLNFIKDHLVPISDEDSDG